MISQLSKSIRLNRFHMLVVIVLSSIIALVLLQYFAMIEAGFEQYAFRNNIDLLDRLLLMRQMIANDSANSCTLLDKPDFIFQAGNMMSTKVTPLSDHKNTIAGKWDYDAKQHTLIYYVRSKRYFRSPLGQQIHVVFYCANNKIAFKVSAHQWCVEKHMFYCGKWHA
jgi:hypothetical protein